MSDLEPLPYREPIFSTAEACKILGATRNTLAGQLARYDYALKQVGVEAGTQGVARSFTLEHLGLFSAVRSALPVRQSESVLDQLDKIVEHARELYEELSSGLRLEPVFFRDGRREELRPNFPQPKAEKHLQGHNLLGNQWAFKLEHRAPWEVGFEVRNLLNYPLPVIVLPIDQTLRNAWQRATLLKCGIDLGDARADGLGEVDE